MTRGRSLTSFVIMGLLLAAQLQVWGARGCSMCGGSCRCASRGAAASCTLRSLGCGGDASGSTTGSSISLHAVLAGSPAAAVDRTFVLVHSAAPARPPQPARPPLDRPPRASC